MLNVILASQSEIRKRALDLLRIPYETCPSHFDEKSIRDTDPLKMAVRLSEAKARTVGAIRQGVIIASDAFMLFKNKIIEKPSSLKEAERMLKAFSGETYTFITGLAVYNSISHEMQTAVETCEIHFRHLAEKEIQDYISHKPVLKFAGAHDTDGVIQFSQKISGNCNFFTALPMNQLIHFLIKQGILTQ